MTTTRRLGCIGTLVAALALAGCGDAPQIQRQEKRIEITLPADCYEVVSASHNGHMCMYLTYKTQQGNYVTQKYSSDLPPNRIDWVKPKNAQTQPESPFVEQPKEGSR